ncbi:MAG TPA: DAK2 domain-containing protein, partial [Candidatus Limnocylindrales bacterium]|nr:DAK2 domain-containing protein [Candidatus Limnocylindrales bacterium]
MGADAVHARGLRVESAHRDLAADGAGASHGHLPWRAKEHPGPARAAVRIARRRRAQIAPLPEDRTLATGPANPPRPSRSAGRATPVARGRAVPGDPTHGHRSEPSEGRAAPRVVRRADQRQQRGRISVAATLLAAFAAAVENLEAHVDEINALNVYPVPDGDTGSNMLATVRAALEEGQRARRGGVDAMSAAIGFGALMGARGNSGVITSQILRGIAESAAGKTRLTGRDLADAFAAGTRVAYAAVAQPVEGTMLTVAREASESAVAAADRGGDVGAVLDAALHAAAASVRRTPSLLAVLRESGVVDAGGQALFRLLEGAAGAPVAAEEPGARILATPATAPHVHSLTAEGAADGQASRFGYETLFLVEAPQGTRLDIPAMRERLESLGESVLVAGDERRVKVHVHGERPDSVIGYGLSLGILTNISVENLDVQAAGVREGREEAVSRDLPNLHTEPVETEP